MKNKRLSMTAVWIAAVMLFQSVCLPAQAQWAQVDVNQQKTPTSTWILIGVGGALVITGIIILIAKASKKKQVKIRDLSQENFLSAPFSDKTGLYTITPVDHEKDFNPAPNQFSGYIVKQLNFISENLPDGASQDRPARETGNAGD